MTVLYDQDDGKDLNIVDAVTPGSLTGKNAALVHVTNPSSGGGGDVNTHDGAGNALTSTDEGGGVRSLDVAVKSSITSGPTATEGSAIGTQGVPMLGKDGQGNAEFLPIAEVGLAHPDKGFMLLGTDDTTARAAKIRINGALRVEELPYLWNVAEGNVPNHVGQSKHVHVNYAATGRQFFVAGTWNEQATGAQRSLVSSSANDAAAGTGARKVVIEYIKGDGTAGEEVVTLNGTTPVDTVATDIKWINDLKIISAGSGGVAAGTIDLHATTAGGGVIVCQLLTGHTNGHYGIMYIPTGYTLYVTRMEFTASDKFSVEVWASVDETGRGGDLIERLVKQYYFDKKGFSSELAIPLVVPGGGKVYAYVNPDAANELVNAELFGWMEF